MYLGNSRGTGCERGNRSGERSRPTASRWSERLATDKVRWVQLFYTDVFGGLNQLDIPVHALEAEMFRTGVPKLDGSSVRGFREIFESDMLLVPDPRTMANIPWNPEAGRTVRFICDVRLGASSEPYEHDPRGVARKAEQVLAAAGYDRSYWGPGDRVLRVRQRPARPVLARGPGRVGRGGLPHRPIRGALEHGRRPANDPLQGRLPPDAPDRLPSVGLRARDVQHPRRRLPHRHGRPPPRGGRPRASRRSTSGSTSWSRWPTTSRTSAT